MTDISGFMETGIHHFPHQVNQQKASHLLTLVHKDRDFGPNIFLDEKTFKEDPKFKGVNPEPGRNLAEKLAEHIDFIDKDLHIVENLELVLGKGYRIKDKKFVCGVPQQWMPDWVKQYIQESGVKNLGPYIRPEFRDITYFSGIDFHQDIIDWPSMGPHFITMYVYLDTVGINDAPLHVIPYSHLQGATTFPHNLERLNEDEWKYSAPNGKPDVYKHRLLTGDCGDVSLWHPFILHGTQPDTNNKPRISLRYLIQVADPQADTPCALHDLNRRIRGHMSLEATRRDLDESGEAVLRGNHVNQIKY